MDARVWIICKNLSGNTTGNDGNTFSKVNRDSLFLGTFRGGFVVLKHFGWESLHAKPYCGLDVVVYMLKCVFCSDILLKFLV